MKIILTEKQFNNLVVEQVANKRFVPIPLDKVPSLPPLSSEYIQNITKIFNDFYAKLDASGKLNDNSDFYDEINHHFIKMYGLDRKVKVYKSGWLYTHPKTQEVSFIESDNKNRIPGLSQSEANKKNYKWVDNYETYEEVSREKYKKLFELLTKLAEIEWDLRKTQLPFNK
jgi:hypothetical protein